MKISRTKFILLFLASALAFQFISNSILGPEVRLFPMSGEAFPGAGSPEAWKSGLAVIIYPLKVILLGPLLFLFKLPDPPPPLLVLAFACYWSLIAFILHLALGKVIARQKG